MSFEAFQAISIAKGLEDGRDPHGVAAQALDVVELLSEALEVSAVPEGHVLGRPTALWPRLSGSHVEALRVELVVLRVPVREAVREELVDHQRAPIGRRGVVNMARPLAVIELRLISALKVEVPRRVLLANQEAFHIMY